MDSQEKRTNQAAEILKMLAHPGRMQILILLAQQGQLTVAAINDKLKIKQPLLSHYLIKMSDKGVLSRRRQGRELYYSLTDSSLVNIANLLLN